MKTLTKFVFFIALSPLIPLVLLGVTEGSCYLLNSPHNLSCSSSLRGWTEAFAYLGILGWIVTIPFALLLFFVGALFNVVFGNQKQ